MLGKPTVTLISFKVRVTYVCFGGIYDLTVFLLSLTRLVMYRPGRGSDLLAFLSLLRVHVLASVAGRQTFSS